jgi:hypothetical protein
MGCKTGVRVNLNCIYKDTHDDFLICSGKTGSQSKVKKEI